MPQNRSSVLTCSTGFLLRFRSWSGDIAIYLKRFLRMCVCTLEVLIKIRLSCDGERVTVMDFIRNHSQLFTIF